MENSNKDLPLKETLKASIIKVLKNDTRAMPLNVLMHKVFMDMRSVLPKTFIKTEDFSEALQELMSTYHVGKNQFKKYFIEYLDYEENEDGGEGYLEIDQVSGNGYITIKSHKNEYRKSSYFVHKKNLNGAKHGDYVRFKKLNITNKKHFIKFALIDAVVKEILPTPT